jgi:hypothetical protein
MTAQLVKLITILGGDATLQTLLGGSISDTRIYPAISDQSETFPCITYQETGGGFRTTPSNVQDITVDLIIYSKDNKDAVEAIFSRVNALLNYYKQVSSYPRIVYAKLVYSADDNDTDRRLFAKVARYQIWSKQS